ncbi:DUF3150 domain-containing protein [Metallibacterium scheffleri]|uniref:DUF3150 domain-containing protein n=1 Tax=Metallibacterium scheffleri TaxID=993689 RepID=A0A4S3KTQ9_9GAMM|nr:DUF3150 domain-containing protein [Metallibacterium scheffleri]THD11654.1 hypothetical protein B1806_02660 [Metallibacterium scheffleri]
MNTNAVTNLDDLILVQFEACASSLCGRASRGVDYDTKNMPPSDVLSGGVRHFCSPAHNQVFNTLRKRADAECGRVGFQLLKGFGVPRSAVADLDMALRKIASEYTDAADSLCRNLDDYYREWEEKHPEWVAVLRRDRPEPSEVRARYRFSHVCYRLKPASDNPDDPINEGMAITQGSLLGAILGDVAKTAQQLLDERFEAKAYVTSSAVMAVMALGAKLKGLIIVEPAIESVAHLIGVVTESIGGQSSRRLGDREALTLRGLLTMLTNPERIIAQGAAFNTDELAAITVDEVQTTPQAQPAGEESPAERLADESPTSVQAAILF